MKQFLSGAIIIISGFLLTGLMSVVLAATTLRISQIGGSTPPEAFTTWTYTSENPLFLGVAAPNASVKISLNDATNTVTANANGDWSFAPVTLVTGAHKVVVTSGTETLSFTLTIAPSGSVTATPAIVPTAAPTAAAASLTTSSSNLGRGGGSAAASSSGSLPVTGTKDYLVGLISLGGLLVTLGIGFRLVHLELEKIESS